MTEDQQAQLEREVELGNQGRLVLNNVAFRSAFDLRKAEIFLSFTDTTYDDPEGRDEAWRTMQNLISLEQYFDDILTTGKMASDTLKSHTKKD